MNKRASVMPARAMRGTRIQNLRRLPRAMTLGKTGWLNANNMLQRMPYGSDQLTKNNNKHIYNFSMNARVQCANCFHEKS